MILVLIAAAIIAGFIGEPQDTIAIVVIVFLNGILGFVQEAGAERAVLALRKAVDLRALVVRDGREQSVPARQLVPGDAVVPRGNDDRHLRG